jgi:general stress protein 26
MPTTGAAELTARAIIDASLYLVLATADGTGRPWSSPVYFAHDGYAEFLWVSAHRDACSRLSLPACRCWGRCTSCGTA